MARQKNTQTMEKAPMEIKIIHGPRRAIPPWGDQVRLRPSKRVLSSESSGKELGKAREEITLTNPKGDILTLLEKGHFNFAHRGDILTLL